MLTKIVTIFKCWGIATNDLNSWEQNMVQQWLKLIHVMVDSWWYEGKTDSKVSKVSQRRLSPKNPEWEPISAAISLLIGCTCGNYISEAPSPLRGMVQSSSQALGTRRAESPPSPQSLILHLVLVKAHFYLSLFWPNSSCPCLLSSYLSAIASVSLAPSDCRFVVWPPTLVPAT